MRASVLVPLALASTLPSQTAHAGDHDRAEVMIADGIGDGLIVLSLPFLGHGTGPQLVLWTGVGGQLLAAPIIHAVNGDYGRGAASLGVRLAAPTAGFFVADVICDHVTPKDETFLRCLGSDLIGTAIGIVLAQATDWLVFSRPADDGTATPRLLQIGGRF